MFLTSLFLGWTWVDWQRKSKFVQRLWDEQVNQHSLCLCVNMSCSVRIAARTCTLIYEGCSPKHSNGNPQDMKMNCWRLNNLIFFNLNNLTSLVWENHSTKPEMFSILPLEFTYTKDTGSAHHHCVLIKPMLWPLAGKGWNWPKD